MTVQELINEMLLACGDKDPRSVEVKKVIPTSESSWGFAEEWDDPYVDAAGGNDYPLVVLLK